ncbi:peptide/nickel transport system ATP-binding protein [Salinihabitans flavidus]|uniref:Peptide/nickel transport system ATP-binding protein n=1 Tax=Salinihabitans flavidus TaxID=569882 RepID=A0A1H8QWL4_9RHOB|nr:ABC transporter ATP-binding protein [Salinihabitans flavidus]SEO58575.1 peptide/nickel transport system ATP-binding protein [Salinihabitans flavidus]
MTELLKVEGLSIGFGSDAPVVDDVSFSVAAGETLALVGESGSGKTLSCRAALRILPGAAQVRAGRVMFHGRDGPRDLLGLSERRMCDIRGDRITMIFQEPMRSLSPLHRIGNQVVEVLRLHGKASSGRGRRRVLDTFARVGFADPERIWRAYPFELSGGMRQRAMIAMAIVSEPELLIADEPTTALDVTTQAQVLGLIKQVQKDIGMGVILVTHDLGVVANMADTVTVMNRGHVVEAGRAHDVLGDPAHGYTRHLFAAAPAIPEVCELPHEADDRDLILEMTDVSKSYFVRGAAPWSPKLCVQAVRGVSLAVERGRTLAVVGESGSGKTTCARLALGAEPPDRGGQIRFRHASGSDPIDVTALSRDEKMAFKRHAQMVFQDPYSTLNPRMRVKEALTEPLEIHRIGTGAERLDRAAEVLRWVGLSPNMLPRFPHAFSGGQRQRLSIARALMLDPDFLVCDEPTSALDVSVQDQILTLLEDIRDRLNLSYLFISHDLAVVARIADEVAVMRQGLVVEQGVPEALFHDPQHPYTRALIAAQPEPDLARPIDLGIVAQGAGAPDGWPEAYRFTGNIAPPLSVVAPGHRVRCHV